MPVIKIHYFSDDLPRLQKTSKGVIVPGSDADIVVYDPEADTVITAQTQLSAAGYTPYEGFKTKGSIAQVYLRGTLAVDHGEMKTGPIGTYIPRHPGSL